MPIYQTKNSLIEQLETDEFKNEKELQAFFEENLEKLLGIKFIASEFWTGGTDGGYIDTVGLDRDGNPVVIEYKWKENNSVINQGLFYIDQILEHKGDFEIKVREKIDNKIKINWKQPRLIIIDPSYNKFDQHAVKRIGGNIELVKYTRYKSGIINLETVFSGSVVAAKPGISLTSSDSKKDEDPLKRHLDWLASNSKNTLDLFAKLREEILNLDKDITEKQYKSGISFRLNTTSFAALTPWRSYVRVYITHRGKLDDPRKLARNVKGIGTAFASTHDFQVDKYEDVDYALGLIKQAYNEAL